MINIPAEGQYNMHNTDFCPHANFVEFIWQNMYDRLLKDFPSDDLFKDEYPEERKHGQRPHCRRFFCIGETLGEKRKKRTNKVLAKQIYNGLKSIKNTSNIIIAYEPVWSIGTGIIPKANDLLNSISYIKSKFSKKTPKVLYGGSVNNKNIDQLKDINIIDGFLIGGASQSSKKFIDIIKKTFN